MAKRYKVLAMATAAVMSMTSLLYGQDTNLSGKWQVSQEGKKGKTLLTLQQSGDSIVGNWQPKKGPWSDIQNVKFSEGTLTFSFDHDKDHLDATCHIKGDTMSIEVTERSGNGKPETIHATANRVTHG